jgi:predicted nucleic acid-binding protein
MSAQQLRLSHAVERFEVVLLDTCILITEYNRTAAEPTLPLIPRPQRRTSVIALWEFLHGPAGALIAAENRARRERWLDQQDIRPLKLTPTVSDTFRSLLRLPHGPPGAVDCLLAAEAVARRHPLVTYNVKDFEHISGLLLVAR